MINKCKICGGDIQFASGDTYGQCSHCGNTFMIPKADDGRKLEQNNRANHVGSAIAPGSIVRFGKYNLQSSPEPIEWMTLIAEEEKVLLLSRYGLDNHPYSSDYTKKSHVVWENSTLRAWLNNEFLNKAFTEEEQSLILTTEVDNSSSQGCFDTDGGNDTRDRVFLLSYAEAWRAFRNDSARKCQPTAYAVKRGAFREKDGQCMWWLRSPGASENTACFVMQDGRRGNNEAFYRFPAVRPAMWVKADAEIFRKASSV